jgi:uncharacterized protein YdaU (DUF1376 family)
MHYYQFNIADYRKDTVHLSPIEHYIYRYLIDWYYLDEKQIPKETQVVMRRLSLDTDGLHCLTNVLSDFFILTDLGYFHSHIERDLEMYRTQSAKNRVNGKLGGRPKKTQVVLDDNHLATQNNPNQELLTTNQEPITKVKNNKKISIKTFIENKKLENKKIFEDDDAIFEFAENANIPHDFLRLAWLSFRDDFIDDEKKKQIDWKATFRNYLRRDYIKIWYFKENECLLNTKGITLQTYYKNKGIQ